MPKRKARGPTAVVAVNRAPVDCLSETRDDSAADHLIQAVTSLLRLVIDPTLSGRKWIALLDDRLICRSAWPFVKSARLLLAEGYPADTVVEIWRPNTDEWATPGRAAPRTAHLLELASEMAKGGPPVALIPEPFLGWTMTPSNRATLLGVHDGAHCDAKRFVAKPGPAGEQAL
jgi:hypothetical protein